ncbi:hypothetical protein PAMP_010447 [Pampus punctatissimus]
MLRGSVLMLSVQTVCKWAVTLLCASAAWRGGKPSFGRRQAGTQARQIQQIQQLSFTLLLLLALLYPIALTATSLSLFSLSSYTHCISCIPMRQGREVAFLFQLQKGKEWPRDAAPLLATTPVDGCRRQDEPLAACSSLTRPESIRQNAALASL